MLSYSLDGGCQSQLDGGPNKKFGYRQRAGIIKWSLKNCKMTAYSQVNQTIAPVQDYCSVRHRCIVGNVVLELLRDAGLLRSAVCGLRSAVCDLRDGSNDKYHPRGRRKPFRGPPRALTLTYSMCSSYIQKDARTTRLQDYYKNT